MWVPPDSGQSHLENPTVTVSAYTVFTNRVIFRDPKWTFFGEGGTS